MDTASHLPAALDTLKSALLTFHDAHPFLAALLLMVYALGVFMFSVPLCAGLCDPRTIPWLHPVFLTDGILVCCCPLAAVLPILLWPMFVLCGLLVSFGRWFLAAPTFCGIRREAFIRPYRACAAKLRQWWARGLRDRKQRRALLPVATGGLSYAPRMSYGAVNGGRTRVDREEYSSPRGQHMQYARQAPCQTDGASVMSVPPPYQE